MRAVGDEPIHVMVAVLRDADGRVLINQRPEGKPQAGRWELPGGKLEPSEAPEAGLRRELLEELGIVAGPMRRLIEIRHVYPELTVQLDVREIAHFGGEPHSREGQALRWVEPEQLPEADILEADRPIVQAIRLPEACLVTPDVSWPDRDAFLEGLDASLARSGIQLVQLRAKHLSRQQYLALAVEAVAVCRRRGARILLNGDPDLLRSVDADGIHLDGARLRRMRRRPVPGNLWLSASCHNLVELHSAMQLNADFALVSPVRRTPSHPEIEGMGWRAFENLAREATLPLYALGGMTMADIDEVRLRGGQGVAGISGLWGG